MGNTDKKATLTLRVHQYLDALLAPQFAPGGAPVHRPRLFQPRGPRHVRQGGTHHHPIK